MTDIGDPKSLRQFRIRDLQMKKPRAEVDAAVAAAGGSPEDSSWVPAAEQARLENQYGRSFGTSDLKTLWPRLEPGETVFEVERSPVAPEISFNRVPTADEETVYVMFGGREDAGIAKCPASKVEHNLMPFFAASQEILSLAADEFTSWLLVEQEHIGEPLKYRYWGRFWCDRLDH